MPAAHRITDCAGSPAATLILGRSELGAAMSRTRHAAVAAVLLGLASMLVVAGPASATELPKYCVGPAGDATTLGISADQVIGGTVAIYGEATSVSLATLDLTVSPYTDPSRSMWWWSLLWFAVPYFDGPPAGPVAGSSDPIGDLAIALSRAPDPGSASPEALALTWTTGWSEGTNTRREQSLNCLYSLTHDDRLVPALRAAAVTNQDLVRYYGPPNHFVHNHGTMANQALIDTAELLGDAGLHEVAVQRLLAEIPLLFSPMGFTYEQSSDYLVNNIALWAEVQEQLASDPMADADARATLATALAAARRMSAHLVDPTGHTPAIGDGNPRLGPRPAPQSRLWLRDDVGGVSVGRWSWTNAGTSWWAMRHGRSTRMHGHHDQGSIEWSTLGLPVLIDPGSYSHDTTNPIVTWAASPSAHNVAVPRGVNTSSLGASVTSQRRYGWTDTITVSNSTWRYPVTVTAVVDDYHHRLTLTNKVAAGFATHLHLAPSWTYHHVRGNTWVFVTSTRVLTITSTTPVLSARVLRGSMSPIGGWVFPAFATKTPACELVVSTTGTQSLVLTVTRR
jgi:hypothetical protein